MELNPNHEVTQKVHDHWHKFAALIMHKLGQTEVVITMDDIESLHANGGVNISVQELYEGIHLKLVGEEESKALLKQHGGLPI